MNLRMNKESQTMFIGIRFSLSGKLFSLSGKFGPI
jgi:hypothetical protein